MASDFLDSLQFCHMACNKGVVRRNNQDAILAMPSAGLFVLSDGMGGGAAGAVASKMVVEQAAKLRTFNHESPGARARLLHQSLQKANENIISYAEMKHYDMMGATAVVLLLDPWQSDMAELCHVGDSRCYCFRNNELFQLTDDDILENSGQKRHVLTNSVGAAPFFCPTWNRIAVCPNDLFILCSDGLTTAIDDALLTRLMTSIPHERLAEQLEKNILLAGAPDNYSFILLKIKKHLHGAPNVSLDDRLESDYLYSLLN